MFLAFTDKNFSKMENISTLIVNTYCTLCKTVSQQHIENMKWCPLIPAIQLGLGGEHSMSLNTLNIQHKDLRSTSIFITQKYWTISKEVYATIPNQDFNPHAKIWLHTVINNASPNKKRLDVNIVHMLTYLKLHIIIFQTDSTYKLIHALHFQLVTNTNCEFIYFNRHMQV